MGSLSHRAIEAHPMSATCAEFAACSPPTALYYVILSGF